MKIEHRKMGRHRSTKFRDLGSSFGLHQLHLLRRGDEPRVLVFTATSKEDENERSPQAVRVEFTQDEALGLLRSLTALLTEGSA